MRINSPKWIKRHLEIAQNISTWSKDPHTQVGAVIVSEKGKPKSWGFNGIAMGVKDCEERFKRPTKYNFFAHAERNAIDLSESSLENCILFCTHSPCSGCATSIVNNQIKSVIVDGDNGFLNGKFITRNDSSLLSHHASLEMYTESGIVYLEFNKNTNELFNIIKIRGEKPYVRKIPV